MVAAACGGENRRGESAQRGGRRQTQRILTDRENRRKQRNQHQQGQRRLGVDQRVQAHGGEDRQVQHGNPGALQNQGIALAPVTQPPAQPQQADSRSGNAGIAQLDRHHHALGGVTQEEGQTEEQQHRADTQHRIAAEQPIAHGTDGLPDQAGRGGRWRCLRTHRRRDRHGFDLRRTGLGYGRGGNRRRRQIARQLPDQLAVQITIIRRSRRHGRFRQLGTGRQR